MANEYNTRALLKKYLGDITDTDRDDLIDGVLTAASRSIDDYCGRRFYLDSVASARSFNPAGRMYYDEMLVDDIGDVTGLIVEVGSSADGWSAVTTSMGTSPVWPAVLSGTKCLPVCSGS